MHTSGKVVDLQELFMKLVEATGAVAAVPERWEREIKATARMNSFVVAIFGGFFE